MRNNNAHELKEDLLRDSVEYAKMLKGDSCEASKTGGETKGRGVFRCDILQNAAGDLSFQRLRQNPQIYSPDTGDIF